MNGVSWCSSACQRLSYWWQWGFDLCKGDHAYRRKQCQATIDPLIKDVLFDLAIALEEPTNLPVDIEHVVAALVLAARNSDIDTNKDIFDNDPELISVLEVHVKSVFALYGGKVGSDE